MRITAPTGVERRTSNVACFLQDRRQELAADDTFDDFYG